MKLKKDNLLTLYVIFNLVYIFFSSILRVYEIIDLEFLSYGLYAFMVINFILILILFFKKKYIKNKIDIFLVLIIIFAIISYLFAYSKEQAFFGSYYRYEGLLMILYYLSILFLSSYVKKEDRIKIVYFILIMGIFNSLYAICQKLDLFNVKTTIFKRERWTAGFIMNPDFFSSFILICICYSLGLFADTKNRKHMVFYLVISSIFFISMLFADSLCNMVGLFFAMIVLLIYCIKNKIMKRFLVICLVLLSILLSIHFLKLTKIVDDVFVTANETTSIVKGESNDDYGTGRVELWRKTIDVVPKYIIHGIGIDNFDHIINGRPIIRNRFVYDKAHNEYLQILVTMGIFSLISYVCLHFIVIKNGIKKCFKNKEIYFILPVIGYLVQAQFNISVIDVAPIFYISLGLLINRTDKNTN